MNQSNNFEKGKKYLQRIEQIREEEHLTQKEICKAMGLSYVALYSRAEQKKTYHIKTLRALKEFITMYETEYSLWKVRMKLFTQ